MITIVLKGHDYQYEVGELIKVFAGGQKITFVEDEALVGNQSFLFVSTLAIHGGTYEISGALLKDQQLLLEKKIKGILEEKDDLAKRKVIKKKIKLCIYDILTAYYQWSPPWGILTGIRPTKIVHELMDQQIEGHAIEEKLKIEYRISDEKIALVLNIAEIERPFLNIHGDGFLNLYVSIPFCPTRCIYCSFPSNSLDKGKNPIEEYLKALHYEIIEIGKLIKNSGKIIRTLYIGGGTPTTLAPSELDDLLKTIDQNMDLSFVQEITVEAGRPDTITIEKLKVLKENGVDRISINPQTMNQRTLDAIGRSHTPKDIIDKYVLAKEIGFKTINMDVIIGLPGETPEMVLNTMKQLEKLNPESITVHTLAVKKTSSLKERLEEYPLVDEDQAKDMLGITMDYANKMEMVPYYMYRQKYMVGNLENTGYCKLGHEGIYNIQIMEERESIIALGAGAISKVVYKDENRVERVANVTNIDHYIHRIEEMVQRKRIELDKLSKNNIDR